MRLELYEKFETELTDQEYQLKEMGIPVYRTYSYQRIYPLVSEITPVEIKGNSKECMVNIGGCRITVLYNYDDLCIKLNDLQNASIET